MLARLAIIPNNRFIPIKYNRSQRMICPGVTQVKLFNIKHHCSLQAPPFAVHEFDEKFQIQNIGYGKLLHLNMKKTTVINALSELPNEFNLDKLLERLLVIEKIDEGLKDAKAGKTISHESAKKIISKWQR
jgi:hypothetical protein